MASNQEEQPFSKRDEAVAAQFADATLTGSEPPLMKLAARTSAVAVDRWGVELESEEQEHENFGEVLDDATDDVLRHYSDEDAHVDGVEELVFEGRPISAAELVEAAEELTDVVEAEGGFDRNSPGGLVEAV